MDLYFSGGETPDHRKRLIAAGVKHIAISYWGLRKRIVNPKEWSIAERFPADVKILLDSGAFSASKKADYTDDDWINYVDEYMDFVELNSDRITMVNEFDAPVIDHEDIEQMRDDFWNSVPADRFMPVWHESHGGLPELEKLAEQYDLVGITNEVFNQKRNMASRLNHLVQTYGVHIHGLGITKPDELRDIRFGSVSSTSWVSPMRFGDTIVWDGTKLVRYPVKYKEQARRRHRMLFERHGFDAEAIANDDPNEVTAFSIWSWLRFEERLNQRKGDRSLFVVPEPDDELFSDEVADEVLRAEHPNGRGANLWYNRSATSGITREGYQHLYLLQEGCCGMCHEAAEDEWSMCVDHDHKTGIVRGLLCQSCNLALGHLKDNPTRAIEAASYLHSPPASSLSGESLTISDDVAHTWGEASEPDSAEVAPTSVAISPSEERNLPAPRDEGQRMLPVFGLQDLAVQNEQGETVGSQQVLRLSGDSLRQCDSCHVSATCPAVQPGSACAFNFPVQIQTHDQLQGALKAVMEMQLSRIAFARMSEELEGGYPDPNVSSEMDRMFRLAKLMKEINDNRESFKIEVEAKGQAGVLSRIFGERALPAANVIDSEKAEAFMGEVFDADVVDT